MHYEDYFLERVQTYPRASYACMAKIEDYIRHSTAKGTDEVHRVHPLLIPKIYSARAMRDFEAITKTAWTIFVKTILAYKKDVKVRQLFGFDSELEELICVDAGYTCLLPIARFDIFYHEDSGDFTFCEVNTDGTSAMNENRELENSLAYNSIYQDYCREFPGRQPRGFELFDSWIEPFLTIYREYAIRFDRPERPRITIVDFLEDAYMEDFVEFQKRFEDRGYSCRICEIRALRFAGGVLYDGDGEQIDAVYRRATTGQIMQRRDEVQDFLAAYRAQAFCMIGSFATQVIHNKMLFYALRQPALMRYFSDSEIEFIGKHIPYTDVLTPERILQDDLMVTKDRWILKPIDSFGAQGIHLGSEESEAEWRRSLITCAGGTPYLYQDFHMPAKTPNAEPDDEHRTMVIGSYHNMTGLYVYAGQLAGLYTRVCENKLIAGQFGGKELVSLHV